MNLNHRLVFALCVGVACVATSTSAAARRGVIASEAAAQLVVDNAVSKTAIGPQPGERCMVVGVPLREGWQVPMVNGRPALRITGADRWQFRATDTWPNGSV